MYYSDELYHYGVKGMHWGIRRFQPYPSDYHGDGKFKGKNSKRVREKKIDPVEERYRQIKKERKEARKKKNIYTLSDEELNKRINRMKQENTYSQLLGRSSVNDVNKGKQVAGRVLKAVGSKFLLPAGIGLAVYASKSSLPKQMAKMKAFQTKDGKADNGKIKEAIDTIFKTVNEKKK